MKANTNTNTKTMAILYAAFKETMDDMNEAEGLTTFTELEQITQDCIIQDMQEREDGCWA